jgi:hypothetical protein
MVDPNHCCPSRGGGGEGRTFGFTFPLDEQTYRSKETIANLGNEGERTLRWYTNSIAKDVDQPQGPHASPLSQSTNRTSMK